MQRGPQRPTLSRRRLGALALGAGALGLTGCGAQATSRLGAQNTAAGPAPAGAAPAAGALGANFNGAPEMVTFDELRATGTDWLRGFHTMHDDPGKGAVPLLRTASERGYRTALSLKFQYHDKDLPRPGTPEMDAELRRVDPVLDAAQSWLDVLAVGNEPFLETKPGQQDQRLNEFYEAVARHVIDRLGPQRRTRLYMGALNHLEKAEDRTPATARWVEFAARTPELDGVDIHPHVADPADVGVYVDYVLSRLRPDQSFLVTEFSLVLLWQDRLKEPISDRYAAASGLQRGTPVWRAIRQAIEHPVPQEQWNLLLSTSPWYENHKHFLREQVQRFRGTGRLALASYGLAHDDAMIDNFGLGKPPWLLNSLFASRTVQPAPNGLPGQGYAWLDDFRALQQNPPR